MAIAAIISYHLTSMIDSTGFTDEEVKLIRHKFRQGFEQGMMLLLLITPLICAIGPYIPGKKNGSLINKMDYVDAFSWFAIPWSLMVLAVWIWQGYRYNQQFSELKPFLTRKQYIVTIERRSRSAFSSFDDRLVTNLTESLPYIPVTKAQSKMFHPGDTLLVEIEEKTRAVIKMAKEEQASS